MTELRIIPTFHLRGIDPNVALSKYKNKNFPEIIEEKVNIFVSNIQILPKYSEDLRDETFLFQDKSGSKDVYTTLNHTSFKSWEEKGTHNPKTPCMYCRHPVGEKCVYIPIKFVKEGLLTGLDPHCRNECALSSLHREQGLSFITRDPLYKDSEYLLKYLHSLEYGDEPLEEALDWRLLNINGGPLTRKEYAKTNLGYSRTTNIIVPCKVCYAQIKY